MEPTMVSNIENWDMSIDYQTYTLTIGIHRFPVCGSISLCNITYEQLIQLSKMFREAATNLKHWENVPKAY